MKIAIYGSKRQQPVMAQLKDFLALLAERGDTVVMHGKLYRHLCEYIPEALGVVSEVVEGPDFTADMAVSLGGDGTFLRTAMWVGDKELPIVGVNTGHLGYLAALSIDQLCSLPQLIADDCLRIESRSLIEVVEPELPESTGHFALNEVAIIKEESASMIQAEVSLGDNRLADYRADGLIICTSTGSTAYNLSVGGPIVAPTLDVNVISPVAAHSLSMRPLVVGADRTITIVPSGRARHVRLSLDGRSTLIDTGTSIMLRQARHKVLVLQLRDQTFADVLRDKLHWGDM
ncbi:MAG: NAD kinase [Bacteroidales bacterium]|nr:NAD kinase [Bacteroidales bacterium]